MGEHHCLIINQSNFILILLQVFAAYHFLGSNYISATPANYYVAMATLKHMSSCTHAIHSTTRKDIGRKHNGKFVTVSCVSSSPTPEQTGHHDDIHQVKDSPFKRNLRISGMKEPSVIHKAENAIMDHCSTLEGDEGYQCWEAYFEFEDMKKGYAAEAEAEVGAGLKISNPLEKLEELVRRSGGVKSLIEMVHFVSNISKKKKESEVTVRSTVNSSNNTEKWRPDGVPKTQEEREEEEKGLLPDSAFTRMLKRVGRGRFPAWYTPRPDHETD